jgi:hypothetical protein
VTGIERLLGALAERQQPYRKRRLALDPDDCLGADQVACRTE